MEQITIKNLIVRIADNINYVWVLMNEQTNREEFADSLGDAEFYKHGSYPEMRGKIHRRVILTKRGAY